ncbi:MAG: nucleotidyltransferase domain-containing protein [Nanoarchaeota archaeon]
MVQNKTNYKKVDLEIILVLIKGESHVRQLARSIDESHPTVLRKLNGLIKDNAVDFRKEGKNKVFFIKKTLQAKNYVYSAERYKFMNLLRKYPELGIVLEDVLKSVNGHMIILFGSYAKFSAEKESDIDLYIEGKDNTLRSKLKEIHSIINVKIGAFDRDSLLIKEIIKNHIILRGVEEFYERTKFFE